MYHLIHNSLFACRIEDGSVHLLHLREVPSVWPRRGVPLDGREVLASLVVPAAAWPALVAALSLRGHTPEGFYEAQAFHNRPPAPVLATRGEPSVEMQRRREDGEDTPQHVRV